MCVVYGSLIYIMMSDQQNSPVQVTTPADPQVDDLSTEDIEKQLDDAATFTKSQLQQDPQAAAALGATPQLQNEVVDIEKELLDIIIRRLDQNNISEEDAEKLAGEFLDLLPVNDQKDLLEKLRVLSEHNPVVKGIYIEYFKPEEASETQKKLTLMSQHLHQGNIEQALAVVKGGTQ